MPLKFNVHNHNHYLIGYRGLCACKSIGVIPFPMVMISKSDYCHIRSIATVVCNRIMTTIISWSGRHTTTG